MKIVLVESEDFAVWNLRGYLTTALLDRGIEVTVVTPDGPYVPKLIELGVTHVAVPMSRFVSPLRDLKLCYDLYRVFRSIKPDVVHNSTIKPNTFGTVAAWMVGVPRIVTLVCGTGRGFAEGGGWKQWMVRCAASWLYWLAGKITTRMWFLNSDDLAFFVDAGLISREKTLLTPGEGVDLQKFSTDRVDPDAIDKLRAELDVDPSTKVVVMVARVFWSKGVKQFVEASQSIAQSGVPAKFLLVGPIDPDSPDAVPETYLQSKASPHFAYLGFRSDVREIMSLADIMTLPSYYREGVPLVLLQGMAMEKPIVTTDNVGCRETVDEGENGFLVPVQDSEAFASAVKKLLRDDEMRASFGRRSRAKAEAEFDQSLVTKAVLTELYGFDD